MHKRQRQILSRRAVFVGCRFCGETDRPLRNYEGGKICPECLKRKESGARFGHREGRK